MAFDVGETLIDESRIWGEWAGWLGVSLLTLGAALGAGIARGEDHGRALDRVRPGFDFEGERRARRAAGRYDDLHPDDLYPDALPCLAEVRGRGLRVVVGGNTTRDTERMLRELLPESDVVTSSESLGAAKPAPAFFAALARLAGADPQAMVYVGDRIDNDVVPAAAAGMTAIHLRRGPWGLLQADTAEADRAAARIDSLAELPGALRRLRA